MESVIYSNDNVYCSPLHYTLDRLVPVDLQLESGRTRIGTVGLSDSKTQALNHLRASVIGGGRNLLPYNSENKKVISERNGIIAEYLESGDFVLGAISATTFLNGQLLPQFPILVTF